MATCQCYTMEPKARSHYNQPFSDGELFIKQAFWEAKGQKACFAQILTCDAGKSHSPPPQKKDEDFMLQLNFRYPPVN